MKRRDKKERELESLQAGIRNNELLAQKHKSNYEFQFKLYQNWKAKEDIQGIKY